ncbi:MAG TPA: hypothetical protein VGW34_04565 [Allosphingosinicella sp.]|nr:hypothetical protein [Allosphingosinicella sp.]
MSTTDIDNRPDTGNEGGGGRMAAATDKVRDRAGAAREKASAAYIAARERTGAAYGTARDKASTAYDGARERAARAGRRTFDEVEANPVGALIGGLAIGALLAAMLPKSRREEELLGDFGRRLNDTAREAARAAREAGRDKLDELGYNRDTAKQKLSDIAGGAGEALKTSAGAAAQKVKRSPEQ